MTAGTVAKTDKSTLCKLHYKKIRTSINPVRKLEQGIRPYEGKHFSNGVNLPALSEIFARRKSAAILGGNTAKTNTDRFSYWGASPKDMFEFRAGQKDPF